jgi:hypothetical protein
MIYSNFKVLVVHCIFQGATKQSHRVFNNVNFHIYVYMTSIHLVRLCCIFQGATKQSQHIFNKVNLHIHVTNMGG